MSHPYMNVYRSRVGQWRGAGSELMAIVEADIADQVLELYEAHDNSYEYWAEDFEGTSKVRLKEETGNAERVHSY